MGVETGPTDTFLLVTAEKPISGIECHWLWDKQDIPDYWELAWQEANDQTYSVLKEESIGLAINALGDPSKPCRRHNQLHIHICRIDKFNQTQGVHSLREQLVDIDKKITRTPADLS